MNSDGQQRLRVVVFAGGRGAGVLSDSLVRDARVDLTVAINGYDDGASTGEVRRFLGDALGPSDFRKNASRLAGALGSCTDALRSFLDERLPAGAGPATAEERLRGATGMSGDEVARVDTRLERFERERLATGRPFAFADCACGNLVFAGSYLVQNRAFNRAVDDYCGLLGLPPGMVDNVTDGRNAHLVALAEDGRLIPSEAALVDPSRTARVRDIFLIDRPIDDEMHQRLSGAAADEIERFLSDHEVVPVLNPRVKTRLEQADLIVYAAGTQYSSLFPSYLTAGLAETVALNLRATKLLFTNLRIDAGIAETSAVDLVGRVVFYLTNKGKVPVPAPALVTHYVINDPSHPDASQPYVPLGQVDKLEDPRLVRIANYEEGVTGRHDARRILTPFVESLIAPAPRPVIAVLLQNARSVNGIVQTLIEMIRGGVERLNADILVYYVHAEPLAPAFTASLPFPAVHVPPGADVDARIRRFISSGVDYLLLFESSGMYRGEDLVSLCRHASLGRLDAVWGSRRLSLRDIETSYRLRYRKTPMLGAISYLGSHVLSLVYLFLHGRYIADTLSAVRVVRAADALAAPVPLDDEQVNHWLLVRLLRRRAELLELPVQFLPLSPERVKRTTVGGGLAALWTIVRQWLRRPRVADDRA